MSIGTPVECGHATSTTSGTTLSLTTTADIAAGSLIVVAAGTISNVTLSISDGTNSYLATPFTNGAGAHGNLFSCVNAAHLPLGTVITITLSAAASYKGAICVSVSGVGAGDYVGAGASGSSTAPSMTSAALAQAGEIIFGMILIPGGAPTFTEAAGFTSDTAAIFGSASVRMGWQLNVGPAAVTYAPTLSTSQSWAVNLKSFEAAAAAAPSFSRAAPFTYLTL